MPDRTMRKFSYVFEMKVGKGNLLVTGFNFTDTKNPAVISMFKTLVEYCNSDEFNPKTGLCTDDLKRYLSTVAKSGPNKEGMMTQYWQLDEEPVESEKYWKESEEYLRTK
jgi:hypothetical protein